MRKRTSGYIHSDWGNRLSRGCVRWSQ